jgi:hypothetical protein
MYDCYTSIEDLSYTNIPTVVKNVKNVVLINIYEETISSMDDSAVVSFFYLIKLAKSKISNDLNFLSRIFSIINATHTQRVSDNPVLWTVGCSFTKGNGVDFNQRYGYILSKKLNLPETMLAHSGSSIFWAADQILRSDIKKRDIVVWGITNSSRVSYINKFELDSALVDKYVQIQKQKQYWNLNYFDSLSLTISNFKQILQVINFCKKIGAELYLVNLLDHGLISLLLKHFENFIDLAENETNTYLDYGSDNDHPGPKQHKFYAEKIYEFITQNEIHSSHY